jgi:RNA polymerase sigma-70 factor (ECF subfamily)
MEEMRPDEAAPSEPSAAVVAALTENHRRFLSFLEKRVGNRADAEDILQAAFVRGLARAGEIREEDRAVAWFYRLLRNAVVDHWRARASEARAVEALAREQPDASAADPELEAEVCRCFEALLPTLRPEQARLLRRIDLEGARAIDVAEEEGVTANNTMVRLHRARKALRARLEESCRTCATHGCLDCTCGRK